MTGPAAVGVGVLRVHLEVRSAKAPVVLIDGRRQAEFKRREVRGIPMPAGLHRVEIAADASGEIVARLDVELPPREVLEVWYVVAGRAPGGTGTIGLSRDEARRG